MSDMKGSEPKHFRLDIVGDVAVVRLDGRSGRTR